MSVDEFLLPPVRRVTDGLPDEGSRPSGRSSTPRERRTTWRLVRRIALAVLVVVVLALIWVGVRGTLAARAIVSGVESSTALAPLLTSGGPEAEELVSSIQADAAEAHSLTSDPVWRAVEFVPVLGGNLVAVRESVSALDGVTRSALPAFVALGSDDGTSALLTGDLLTGPRDPRLAGLAAAAPRLAVIAPEVAAASARIGRLDPDSVVAPLSPLLTELQSALGTFSSTAEGLGAMTRLAEAVSVAGSPDAGAPFSVVVTAAGSGDPVAFLAVSTTGGVLTVTQVAAASTATGEPADDPRTLTVDIAAVAYFVEQTEPLDIAGTGAMTGAEIGEFAASDAYELRETAADAEYAIGSLAAAAITRLFA